jgi:hypothetical protein
MVGNRLEIKNREVSYLFSAFSILFLLFVIFFPGKNLSNYNNLASRSEGIDIQIRILFNLTVVLLLFLACVIFKKSFMYRPITEKFFPQILILISLTLLAFFPATNLNPQLFSAFAKIYQLIGIGHIGSGFADLAGVLEGATKVDAAGEYFKIDCPGTCVQYRWQYSQYLLNLPFERVLAQNLQLIALIFWLLIIFVSVKFMGKTFFSPIILICFLLPANLLAYERMNIENLIFISIPILAYFSQSKFKDFVLPIIIIALTIIKFYPLVLAVLFLIMDKISIKKLFIYIVTITVGLVLSLPDLQAIGRSNLIAGFAGSYGLQNFLALLSGNVNPTLTGVSLLSYFFGMFFCVYFFIVGFRVRVKTSSLESIEIRLFLIASALSIVAWLTNSNYMYRLILVMWCVPYLIALAKDNRKVISFVLSSLILGLSIIPISLSPIRNILIAQSFSFLTGVFLSIILKFLKISTLSWYTKFGPKSQDSN